MFPLSSLTVWKPSRTHHTRALASSASLRLFNQEKGREAVKLAASREHSEWAGQESHPPGNHSRGSTEPHLPPNLRVADPRPRPKGKTWVF